MSSSLHATSVALMVAGAAVFAACSGGDGSEGASPTPPVDDGGGPGVTDLDGSAPDGQALPAKVDGVDVDQGGTRLKARTLLASGHAQFLGWQDSQANLGCTGQEAAGSPPYCLPPTLFDDRPPLFANATCDAAGRRFRSVGAKTLATSPLLDACFAPGHVLVGDPAPTAPYAPTLHLFPIQTTTAASPATCSLFDPASAPGGAPCRGATGAACSAAPNLLGAEVPLGSLVSGTRAATPGSPLGVERITYADGAQEFVSWHDGTGACSGAVAADGVTRCFPGRYFVTHFLDALCSQAVVALPDGGGSGDPPLPRFAEVDESDSASCATRRRVYAIEGRATARPDLVVGGKVNLFTRSTAGSCVAAASLDPERVAIVGAELVPTQVPELPHAVADGPRLQARYAVSSGFKRLEGWFDKTLGVGCTFGFVGEHYRCVPTEGTVKDTGSGTGVTYFTSASCLDTVRLVKKPAATSCSAPPRYATVSTPCLSALRVFQLVDPPVELFEKKGGVCAPAALPKGFNLSDYRAQGTEVPLSDLAEGTVSP